MTVYVVSGMHRSGTSMMMAAMRAGGMDVLYDPDREGLNVRYQSHGYEPNPSGFWEITSERYMDDRWLRWLAANGHCKAVKIQYKGLSMLPKGEWNIAFMERDPREIKESMEAWFTQSLMPPWFVEWYPEVIAHIKGILQARSDITWRPMQYRAVVENPVRMIGDLGWPIDVEKAAAVVEDRFCRHRVENFAAA